MNLVRVGSLGRYLVMAAVLIFPFSVYFLIDNLGVEWLGVILFILLAARLSPLIRANRWAPIVFLVAGGIFLAALKWTGNAVILQLYPTFISLGLLSAFGVTLIHPPTMIERFATAAGMVVNSRSISYTRAVTILWCIFFTINAAVSAIIAVGGSMRAWTIYNGFLSYIIIGAIFASEYVFRQFYMRRSGHEDGTRKI
jgi:uncharacterized membrane protein